MAPHGDSNSRDASSNVSVIEALLHSQIAGNRRSLPGGEGRDPPQRGGEEARGEHPREPLKRLRDARGFFTKKSAAATYYAAALQTFVNISMLIVVYRLRTPGGRHGYPF